MVICITVSNRGPEPAPLCVLPTLTLRNNWSWRTLEPDTETRPWMGLRDGAVVASHARLGRFRLFPLDGIAEGRDTPETLFTENDTNVARLDPGIEAQPGFFKDAFDRFLVRGEAGAVNPEQYGTKAAFLHRLTLGAGDEVVLRYRLAREDEVEPAPLDAAERVFAERRGEADLFYDTVIAQTCSHDERAVSRQAYAGLLWSKQFYYYVAERWQQGDPAQPPPPEARATNFGEDWSPLFCRDVLSMPDKWEYPWFAAWDLAFHMVSMAKLDPAFAKDQLILMLREWYLHPNGQMPAYEGSWSDVNPPVHAFAVFQVYAVEAGMTGRKDVDFLERAFQKLLLNFTWWVNRNDADGRNLFGGGFLGLDNIGVFDRNRTLPDGVDLAQADATAWMGLFCAAMLRIAVDLAQVRPVYQDIASKFLGHYTAIVDAMNTAGGSGLWDEEEGFYFDRLTAADGTPRALKVHSIVGIVPLFGVLSLRKHELDAMPEFRKRMDWFLEHKPRLGQHVTPVESEDPALAGSYVLSLVPKERMMRVLARVLDEAQFFSPHGIRSLSRLHGDDTTVPVLAKGKTDTGRLWTYVRDDRPFGGAAPPAATFRYSRSRSGEYPRGHLATYGGILQADAYAGYNELYEGRRKPAPVIEAACWSHGRRKFFDIAKLTKAPIAIEAVRRIDEIFAVERIINGLSSAERGAERQQQSKPLILDLEIYLKEQQRLLSAKSDTAKAINYILSRWVAFTRFLDDGRICMSNNAAERSLRGIAIGRRNWTFCGSDAGGHRAAAIYTLIETAKLNDVDPQAWLADVLARLPDHPANHLDGLLPWNWKANRTAAALAQAT